MSTDIRANLSKRNKYYVSKHRYYELKHFCLQFNEWKEEYNSLSGYETGYEDPTADIALRRYELQSMMQLVIDCCYETDPELSDYIFNAVTNERTYVYLSTVLGIPCSRDTYYDRYRKFFSILSSKGRKLYEPA